LNFDGFALRAHAQQLSHSIIRSFEPLSRVTCVCCVRCVRCVVIFGF
jgi:hypothetical protein